MCIRCIVLLYVVAFSLLPAHAEDFRISGILGLTGPSQAWAKSARLGAELAVKEQNEQGGLSGRKVVITFEDSKSTSLGAVSAFKKITATDAPQVIFGDVWTQLFAPLIPLSTLKKITIIAPTVVAASVALEPYSFTMGQKPELVSKAVAHFFDTNTQVKTVAIFCWDNSWGAAYLSVWRREIQKRNIKILHKTCVSDFAYDYKTDVAKVALQKPDAIIIAHQAERILKLFEERKMHPVVLATSNIIEVLNDRTLPARLAEGVYLTDWNASEEFQRKFHNTFGEAPVLEAHNSYESIRSIFRAYEINPQSLRDGFQRLHYEGVGGPIDFRASAAGNDAGAVLRRIKAGKAQNVG